MLDPSSASRNVDSTDRCGPRAGGEPGYRFATARTGRVLGRPAPVVGGFRCHRQPRSHGDRLLLPRKSSDDAWVEEWRRMNRAKPSERSIIIRQHCRTATRVVGGWTAQGSGRGQRRSRSRWGGRHHPPCRFSSSARGCVGEGCRQPVAQTPAYVFRKSRRRSSLPLSLSAGRRGVLKWSGLRANRTDSIRLPQPTRTPSITPTTESVEPSIAQKADRRTSSSTEVLAANAPSIRATLARSSAGAWCRGMA